MRKQATRARKIRRDDTEYLGGFNAKAFREYLRKYNQQPKSRAERAIGAMRLKVHWSRYGEIIHSLQTSAPSHLAALFSVGQRRYGDLLWGEPFPAIPLQDELVWTAHWLKVRHKQLSGFRRASLRIQELVGADQADDALAALTHLAKTTGYTLWQTELQAAVLQLFKGNAEQRVFTAKLRNDAPISSIAGFLAYLIGDRNDESQTYDSFYSRTKERLPRVTVDGWLQAYLFYRVLQHYDPVPEAISLNLRNERLSSLTDLYETFVESILTIVTTFSLKTFRPAVLRALDILSDVQDDRLLRLRVLAGGQLTQPAQSAQGAGQGQFPEVDDERPTYSRWAAIQRLAVWNSPTVEPIAGKLEAEAYEPLAEVWLNGSSADKAVSKALKLGVSLKSLDIGVTIAGQAEKQSGKTERTLLLAPGALIVRANPGWEEIVGGPFDLSLPRLKEYVANECSSDSVSAELLRYVESPPESFDRIPPLGRLWLVTVYDFQGNYAAATKVIDNLEQLGGRWAREAARSRFVMAYSRGDLSQACNLLSTGVINENSVSAELPVSEMFFGRKWKDFSKLDPIEVGIASYCAFDAPATSSVRHISSSSCRAVMKSGFRSLIESPPPTAMPEVRRKEIVFFFANVWDEDALGRTGLFESTQEVRVERIKVMQHLIAWDERNTDFYVSEIKRLTVNESLWLGLKHLNETRVFVNEPAITRWAEKELAEDYQRWLGLVGTESDGEVYTEEKLLQYLAAPVDAHSGVQEFTSLTEADGALILAINRLLTRFLNDPADGLNCYLSLRVRHGTMTGTLFGPSETADLLMPEDEPKEEALLRLSKVYGGEEPTADVVYAALSKFTAAMVAVGADLVKERVQIQSIDKPNGLLYAKINFLALPTTYRNVSRISFDYFIFVSYTMFWLALEHSLSSAREYFNENVRQQLEDLFSTLLDDLQPVADELPALLTAVQQTATLTSAQCGIVANWFQLPKHRGVAQQVFTVSLAVDIASKATSNVYPGFDPELKVEVDDEELPLSGLGLSTVADCLFVILQNVAQRSGNPKSKTVTIKVSLLGDDTLVIRGENAISDPVREQLRAGKLDTLTERYRDAQHNAARTDKEGGSGLAKLWRITRAVDNPLATEPLTFGLTEVGDWYVQVMLKLVSQDGVYHAS
jgi:hypothetical protein